MADLILLYTYLLIYVISAVATLAIGIVELKPEGRLGSRILAMLTPHRRRIAQVLLVSVFLSGLISTIRGTLSESAQKRLDSLRDVQKLTAAAEASLTPYDIVPTSDAKKLCGDLPEGIMNFSDALRFTARAEYNDAEQALRRAEANKEIELYRILRLRGIIEVYRGQYVKALHWYAQASVENPSSLLIGDELAEILTGTGKLQAADNLLVSIINTKRLIARSKDHPSIALSMAHLADTRSEFGRHVEALSIIKKARTSAELHEGQLSSSLIPILEIQASALAAYGETANAHQTYTELGELVRREHGNQSAEYIEYLNNHSMLYDETGDYRRALTLAIRSYHLADQFLDEIHYSRGLILSNIGMVYHLQSDSLIAEGYFRQGLKILQASLGPAHPDTAIVQMNLGRSLTSLNQFDEARRNLRAASLSLEQTVGKGHVLYGNVETAQGVLARQENDYPTALEHYRRALNINLKVFGPKPHADTALLLANIAIIESLSGEHGKAEADIRKSLSMSESILGPDNPALLKTLVNLGAILEAAGNHRGALKAFDRALAVGLPAVGEENKLIQATRKKIKEINQGEGRP